MHSSTVVLVAMLTSVFTAVVTVYVVERYDVLPQEAEQAATVVPELKGLLETDARQNASAVQVALLVAGREPSDEHKPGTVLRQSVPAGQRVPHHHPVSVVLADEVFKVPDVVGLPLEQATLKLKDSGYELKASASVPSSEIEVGHVVEQQPAAGSQLKRGEQVTIKASSGAEELEVPELRGMAHNAAKKKLEELGLEAKFAWVDLAETPSYRVINQKPAKGDKLKPGEPVQLVVNR